MSTLTCAPVGVAGFEPAVKLQPGFFNRIFMRFITAHEARAVRLVHQHLAIYDDKALAELGYSASEIAEISAARRAGGVHWHWI